MLNKREIRLLSLEALVAFSATFFGVVIGFGIQKWDDGTSKEKLYEIKRSASIDECFNVAEYLIDYEAEFESRIDEFTDNPRKNIDLFALVNFPTIFLENFDRDFEFVSRLDERTYDLLLRQTRNLANGLSSINARATEMQRLDAFAQASNGNAPIDIDGFVLSEGLSLKDEITKARGDTYFACFALVIDGCRSGRSKDKFDTFHAAWRNDDSITINHTFETDDCNAIWSSAKIVGNSE